MSGTVDSRIVSMKFDNSAFESGVQKSISTMDKLKSALGKLTQSKSGMDQLNQSAKNFNMGPMGSAVDGVSKKFIALTTVAVTALSNITNRAINAGLSFAKSFTVQPILDGLHEYEQNLKSIQVIQANTDKPLGQVEASLQELNKYSDLTIYNFSEMAKNIGTFTAAGVGLKDSVSSIKGIANIAALSGSSSEQASTAMYQLSQAIASGKVGLQDWNSVVNAGMGGKKLQNALAQTAVAMGVIDKAQVKGTKSGEALKIAGESFRESISAKPGHNSWLTSGVLVNTLATMDGRFSRAALSQELLANGTKKYNSEAEITKHIEEERQKLAKKGVKFTDEQFKALQKMSTSAFKSATEVKTLGQAFDVAKESIGSGWGQVFTNIFGGLKQSKALFTDLSNFMTSHISAAFLSVNNVLAQWNKGGGRLAVIEGLKAGFKALFAILAPIKAAFRDIFPAKTGKDLIAMSKSFRDFMQTLKPSQATIDNIRRTFAGLFAVLHIGWTVVKAAASALFGLFTSATGGEGGILSITASIGDFLVNLDKTIQKSGFVTAFFQTIANTGKTVVSVIKSVTSAFGNLFAGLDGGSIFGIISKALSGIGTAFTNALSNLGVGGTSGVIAAGLGAAVFVAIKKIKGMIGAFLEDSLFGKIKGAFSSITDAFDGLTGVLEGMQQNLKASALLKIAGAVGILAASMVILSGIKPKDLAKSLAAMAGGFAALMAAMALMTKIGGPVGFSIASAGMVALSSAMLVLSVALKVMASMSLKEIGKGLIVLAGAMGIMVTAMAVMSKNTKGIFRAGAAMLMMSAGLLAISVAMKIMASMSWEEMGKGLTGIAASMVILAGAMRLMPKNMTLQAAALVMVGLALNGIATALKILGTGSWESIAKGLVALGGALVVLAAGLALMQGSLLGAAALTVAAAGLALLTPVLVTLGSLSWGTIGKGMAALAGALALLGVAGLVLAPVVLPLMGLGLAIGLIGAGAALAGVGITLLAGGLSTLVSLGGTGITVLTDAIKAIISLIPMALVAFAQGIVGMATVIAKNAPVIAAAFGNVMRSLLGQVIKTIPKVGQALFVLIQTGLSVIRRAFPQFVSTGFSLLMSLLNGIKKNIGNIVNTVAQIIVKFLNALSQNLPKIIDAGFRLIISFIRGITKSINAHRGELVDAGMDMAKAIAHAMASGLGQLGGEVASAAKGLAGKALGAIKDGLHMGGPSKAACELGKTAGRSFGDGLVGMSDHAAGSGTQVVDASVNAMKRALVGASSIMESDVNLSPTITPVIDLTQVRKDASDMDGLLSGKKVSMSTATSRAQANDISNKLIDAKESISGSSSSTEPTVIKFEQNNYSPESLSPIDIYRKTNNQLALAKEAFNAS